MTDLSTTANAATEPAPTTGTYTVPDLAKRLPASERHVWRLVDQGLVPGRIPGIGRLVRFSRTAVDAWLAGDLQFRPATRVGHRSQSNS